LDRARTEAFAAATTRKHPRLRVEVLPSAQDAVGAALVIITVTTSTTPYIPADWIAAGSFVAHVSLDDLTPGALLGAQALYVDDLDLIRDNPQRILGHLLNEEPATHITGTLGAVLEGTCPVVRPLGGYVVSNPFGMSILDVGLTAAVERRARELGLGHVLKLR
jgi:ornithine cyclodeaminase